MNPTAGQDEAPSPTLSRGVCYLSLVLELPAWLAGHVQDWRARQGEGRGVPPHVTVFITQASADPEGRREQIEALRCVCRGVPARSLRLGGTGSFRPLSQVAYLDLQDHDAAALAALHARCCEVLPDASPFEYRPHVTLVQNAPDEVLERALRDFSGLSAQIPLSRLCLFQGDLSGWEQVGTVYLGTEEPGSAEDAEG